MHTWIEIDAAALRHNFREFTKLVGAAKIAPVLKSNAYGHGLKETYEALKSESCAWIAVNYVEEALALRQWGYKGRIMNMGPVFPDQFADAAKHNVELFLSHEENLKAWLQTFSTSSVAVHIKFDTGMSRQGFLAKDAASVADQLKKHWSNIKGICTHFANVEDVLEHDYAALQLKRFQDASQIFHKGGFQGLQHAASSASALLLEKSRMDVCRVGISLYGFWPSQPTRLSFLQHHGDLIDLKPALTWKTKVAMLKDVPKGEFIGYGCTYRAPKDMKVAVLPVGYDEGYPRLAGNDQSYVLIRGNRCELVGRICMNMMMVDVTHCQGAQNNDEVILIGKSGDETVHASDIAGWAQTIHYELVSRLPAEIPRLLK